MPAAAPIDRPADRREDWTGPPARRSRAAAGSRVPRGGRVACAVDPRRRRVACAADPRRRRVAPAFRDGRMDAWMQRDADAAHERIAQLVRQLHEAPPRRARAGGSLCDVHLHLYRYIHFHIYICPHTYVYTYTYTCPQKMYALSAHEHASRSAARTSGLRCAGGGADGRAVGGAVGRGGRRSEGRQAEPRGA